MTTGALAVYVFALCAAAFAAVAMIAGWLLRPRVEDPRKRTTYECGMTPTGTSRVKLNIRFYVFALLFVLFDVEVFFVYPWAVTARDSGPAALLEMMIFLGVLFAGLVYAWGKGALRWDQDYGHRP
jgi:NADH-quinone oxidoreductase subunit A